jgi:hypothetical protein
MGTTEMSARHRPFMVLGLALEATGSPLRSGRFSDLSEVVDEQVRRARLGELPAQPAGVRVDGAGIR